MDVIGIGNPVMDFLIQTKRIPHLNNAGPFEKSSWQGGGKVPTAIVAIGRLGAKTGIMGKVADDAYGRFCRDDLVRHGVDVSRLIVKKGARNAFCLCLAERDTRTRTFIYNQGAVDNITANELDFDYIADSRILHIADMDEVNIVAAKYAKSKDVKVVIDADRNDNLIEENLHLIDVFIASEYYYKSKYGNLDYKNNCIDLSKNGPKIVVFTLGENGCVAYANGVYFEVPAFSNLEIVDTTGAGDVFHGAFIYGLIKEWDIIDALRFASATAAITCTRLGGRAGIPTEDVVMRFMKTGIIDFEEADMREEFYEDGLKNLNL